MDTEIQTPEWVNCFAGGSHLAECDDDGYCSLCGEQESPESLADSIRDALNTFGSYGENVWPAEFHEMAKLLATALPLVEFHQ